MDEERLDNEKIREIRGRNLHATLKRVFTRSKFYKKHYADAGFSLDDLHGIDDLEKIPFIDRSHLVGHGWDMTCEPKSRWIDVCPTSGTSGKYVYFPMTRDDVFFLSNLCARGIRGLGIDDSDTVQLMVTGDNLMQPSYIMTRVFQYKVGCLTLRAGTIGHDRQIRFMRELRPTVVFGLPSYLQALGRSFAEKGFDPKKELNLKLLISTGDTIYHDRWTPTARHLEISGLWGAPYYSILGSTELNTGLVECTARNGHHLHWDYYIAEIIDPQTGKTLPPGEKGELVLTTCGRQAMPLIRYRTGDITSLEVEPCPCGRTSHRIMAVIGRRDQMLKVKGAGVFPLQIEEAVLSVDGVKFYLIEVDNDLSGQERITVTVDTDSDQVKSAVGEAVKIETNVTPVLKSDSRKNIESAWYSEKRVKPRKFWDRRDGREAL